MKKALVLGAGGFIGSHMVKRLKEEKYWVRGVDLKHTEFGRTEADEFIIGDLRNPLVVKEIMAAPKEKELGDESFNKVYQYAATFKFIMAELCMISASLSPVKTYSAPPISAAY